MTPELTTRQFFAFNTVNTISVPAAPGATEALDAAEALCAHYEVLFSRTRPEAQLARVNAAGGARVQVDAEVAALVQAALGYCEASGGLYDITMGAAVRCWNFHTGQVAEPSALQEALTHVNWRGVHVEGNQVWLDDPRAELDLGGIAKGWIADGLAALLRERGIESGIINLGGNVVVLGTKPDGSAWNVGLRAPASSAEAAETSFAAVSVAGASVVTSGIYERAFTQAGVLHHHILDPRTGAPAQTDVVSASVISARSLDGDGYTTALIIMGLEEALAFCEARANLEAVFIGTDGGVYATSGIGTRIPFRML